MEISKEIMDIVNKPGRIGTLGTADTQGRPNVAYFGSPRLSEDGTIVMGLGSNRTLKNLEQNPNAVFFCVAESPVTFTEQLVLKDTCVFVRLERGHLNDIFSRGDRRRFG